MAPTIQAIISAQPPGTKGAASVAASPLPRIPKPGVSFDYMKIIYTNFAKIVAGQWTAEQAMDQSQTQLVDLFKTNGLLK
jgi:ABC-type glycerol-3-phosphate transport system substrate-binding protein